MTGVNGNQIGSGLVGVALLVLGALAWSGRWRSWAKDHTRGPAVLGIAPGTGLLLVGYALYGSLPTEVVATVTVAGLVGATAGWVLYVWEPAWWGPRWWRGRRRDPMADRTVAGAVAMAALPDPERDSEQLARQARRPAEPLHRRAAMLHDPALGRPSGIQIEGVAQGHLLLYRDEVVFVADRGDDVTRPGPTIRSLPAPRITAVTRTSGPRFARRMRFGTVRIDSTDGEPWTLECVAARATVDELRRTYLGGRSSRRVTGT